MLTYLIPMWIRKYSSENIEDITSQQDETWNLISETICSALYNKKEWDKIQKKYEKNSEKSEKNKEEEQY